MASGIKVESRDEEASLRCAVGTFYFGPYDDGTPEPDEADEKACDRYYDWKFVWTRPDKSVVCIIPGEDLPNTDDHSYDDLPAMLLCGIGHCIQRGWLNEGSTPNGESQETAAD